MPSFYLTKAAQEDVDRATQIMLVHDIVEIDAGDITPNCGVSKDDKFKKEYNCAVRLCNIRKNSEILKLFLEFHNQETKLSHLCSDADKLQPLIKTLQYSQLYPNKRSALQDFWDDIDLQIKTKPGHILLSQLKQDKLQLSWN